MIGVFKAVYKWLRNHLGFHIYFAGLFWPLVFGVTYLSTTSAAFFYALGMPKFVEAQLGNLIIGFLSVGAFSLHLAYSGNHEPKNRKRFQYASVSMIITGVILTHHLILFSLRGKELSGALSAFFELSSTIPQLIYINRLLGGILFFLTFYLLFRAVEKSEVILEEDTDQVLERIGRKIMVDEEIIDDNTRFMEAESS